MRAGKLDRRIAIQANVGTTPDESGHTAEDWQTAAEVWAEFKAPSLGREPFTADQYAAFIDAEFTIRPRYDFDIEPGEHRIVFDGKTYNIVGVAEVGGRQDALRIIAKARAETGAPTA